MEISLLLLSSERLGVCYSCNNEQSVYYSVTSWDTSPGVRDFEIDGYFL